MTFTGREIDHLNLTVTNLEQAVKFYTDTLGFEVQHRFHNNGKDFVFLSDGNLTYELMESPTVTHGTLDHIAYVSEDIQQDYDYFKSLKPSPLLGEIGLAEGLFDHGMYYFFIGGNDGERVEFCQKKQL